MTDEYTMVKSVGRLVRKGDRFPLIYRGKNMVIKGILKNLKQNHYEKSAQYVKYRVKGTNYSI